MTNEDVFRGHDYLPSPPDVEYYCYGCDKATSNSNDLYFNESNGEYYCEDCIEEMEDMTRVLELEVDCD